MTTRRWTQDAKPPQPISAAEAIAHLHSSVIAALAAAGRPERARLHDSRYGAISVVLIRERLIEGPLRFCTPEERIHA